MKKLLNTLYITTQGAYLAREGETISVSVDKETRLRLPVHTLEGIVCFGNVMCTPFLMGLCGERNVTLSFLTERGRFMARVHGPVNGNVLLRKEQYRRSDDPGRSAAIACGVVLGKMANSRVVLLRALRDNPELSGGRVEEAIHRLAGLINGIRGEKDLDAIRGIEGVAANCYFSVFDDLIQGDKEAFFFKERNRRPPLDNMNALLSFLYTLLTHDASSAAEAVGLDPAVGFLHRDRPGRPSLALDLVEELRACVADRLALSLINRQQVKARDFERSESGAVTMSEACRKEVLIAWQKKKQEELVHPFLNERVSIGLLPYVQALLLARYIRGDLEAYPPFLWK